jgi:shikimate kinase
MSDPANHPRIVLVGYRGTGKTTVAQKLAQRLDWAWVDGDDALETAAGKSIREIFASDGEPAFRELESALLGPLLRRTLTVIATGGGVVLREENRQQLLEAGPIVWLTASVETLVERLHGDATTRERRPSLTGLPDADEIASLLLVREPLYRSVATLIVDTEDKTPDEIATEILTGLSARS